MSQGKPAGDPYQREYQRENAYAGSCEKPEDAFGAVGDGWGRFMASAPVAFKLAHMGVEAFAFGLHGGGSFRVGRVAVCEGEAPPSLGWLLLALFKHPHKRP